MRASGSHAVRSGVAHVGFVEGVEEPHDLRSLVVAHDELVLVAVPDDPLVRRHRALGRGGAEQDEGFLEAINVSVRGGAGRERGGLGLPWVQFSCFVVSEPPPAARHGRESTRDGAGRGHYGMAWSSREGEDGGDAVIRERSELAGTGY